MKKLSFSLFCVTSFSLSIQPKILSRLSRKASCAILYQTKNKMHCKRAALRKLLKYLMTALTNHPLR
jgi:hypothetical protein